DPRRGRRRDRARCPAAALSRRQRSGSERDGCALEPFFVAAESIRLERDRVAAANGGRGDYCQRSEATRLLPGSSSSAKRLLPLGVLITKLARSGSSLFDRGRVTSTDTVPCTRRSVMISTRSAP